MSSAAIRRLALGATLAFWLVVYLLIWSTF